MKLKKGMLVRIQNNCNVAPRFRNLEVEILNVLEDKIVLKPLNPSDIPGVYGNLRCDIDKVGTHLEYYARNKGK